MPSTSLYASDQIIQAFSPFFCTVCNKRLGRSPGMRLGFSIIATLLTLSVYCSGFYVGLNYHPSVSLYRSWRWRCHSEVATAYSLDQRTALVMDKLTFHWIILVACKFILCLCYALYRGSMYGFLYKQSSYCIYFYVITSGNRTPGSRFYSDLLDTLADSVCIHQLVLKHRSKC